MGCEVVDMRDMRKQLAVVREDLQAVVDELEAAKMGVYLDDEVAELQQMRRRLASEVEELEELMQSQPRPTCWR